MTHPPMVCAVCKQPLYFFQEVADLGTEQGRYGHITEEYGTRTHVATPVPPEEIDHIEVQCDFCGIKGEPCPWTVVTKPFAFHDGLDIRSFSSLWAACTPCMGLIEAGDWPGLVRYSEQVHERANPSRSPREAAARRQAFGMLYLAVKQHFVRVRPQEGNDITSDRAYVSDEVIRKIDAEAETF